MAMKIWNRAFCYLNISWLVFSLHSHRNIGFAKIEKIKVKILCPYFPDIQKSTGKIRTLYISSNWNEMVFIIEDNYEEKERFKAI